MCVKFKGDLYLRLTLCYKNEEDLLGASLVWGIPYKIMINKAIQLVVPSHNSVAQHLLYSLKYRTYIDIIGIPKGCPHLEERNSRQMKKEFSR